MVTDIGFGESLVAKLKSSPGGFEPNYAAMMSAILDAGDALADPAPAVAAWEASPVSLQTKLANDFLMYPSSDNEARYRRVKAKCTLEEFAALDRLKRAAK